MKIRNKILSGILAFALIFGVVGLPAYNLVKAFATSATKYGDELVIKNVNKTYDVGQNNFIRFSDYCEEYALSKSPVKVFVNSPDGEFVPNSTGDGATLTMPGIYAMQFTKTNSSTGNVTYSDVIYIPVSSSGYDSITLDGYLNSIIAPNTVVEIPKAVKSDGSDDTEVSFKVFTPYGEEISAIGDSMTNRWKFTNKSGVLGTYFVEYTKMVTMGNGSPRKIYKYETIEFSIESTNTTSTVYKKDEGSVAEGTVGINISSIGLASEKDELSLFKYYPISKAYIANADGSTNTTDSLYLTVLDTETNKYFNVSTGKFDYSTTDEAKIEVTENTDDFILRSFENFSSIGAEVSGHLIRFRFFATVDGNEVEKVVDKTEKFYSNIINIQTEDLLPSEVTNMVKVESIDNEKDEDFVISSVNFSNIEITTNDGYDLDGLKALIRKVEAQLTPENGSTITSSNAKDSHGVGFETIGTDPLATTFKFCYNKNITTEQKKWTLNYMVTIGEDDSDIMTKSASYTIYARTESKDKTAPSKLVIADYVSVSTDGKFTVPNATAEDKDDDGNTTTGAKIVVLLSGGNIVGTQSVTMGETLTLADGIYKLKYTATDASQNTRTKFVGFKVEAGTATTAPTLNVSDVQYTETEKHFKVTVNTNAENVVIIGGEDGQVSPASIKYVNGEVSEFEFDLDASYGVWAITFSKSNAYATVYKTVQIGEGSVNNEKYKSVGFGTESSGYTTITPNTTLEANTFSKLVWFGGEDFSIEAEEGALYTVTKSNVFTFYTAGTYTITSTEMIEVEGIVSSIKATTTLKIKSSNTALTASQPFGNKLVAEQGEEIQLNIPVVTNFYGYEVDIVVLDSSGNEVTNALSYQGSVIKFTAPKKDEYSILYKFSADGMKSSITSVKVSTGNVATPKITISGNNENRIWNGEKIRYNIQKATALDKNGKTVNVSISCIDANGKELKVVVENGNYYVELESAGFYTVNYTAVDEEGLINVVESKFAVEFPEVKEDNGWSAWQVIGLVFGIMAGSCAIALIIIFAIRHNKNQKRFINKAKRDKKQEKKEVAEKTSLYTIAESKDEKHWIVKNGNRTIAKVGTKAEAIEKAKENHKKGDMSIKVYNKNGRLIDSI